MANINELKTKARVIQNETEDGQNTAERVGSLFYEIIEALENAGGGSSSGGGGTTYDKTSVTVTPLYSSGTRIATISVDGNTKSLYIPGTGSGSGSGGNVIAYDDTEVRQLIVANTQRIQNLVNSMDNEVKDNIESLLADATWVQQHFPSGSGSESNFGQANVETYLQSIGVWEEGEAHTLKNAKWSKIEESVDKIAAKVAVIEGNTSGSGYDELLAQLKLDVVNSDALASVLTEYAKTSDITEIQKVIEWMYSGLKSGANSTTTWADIVAGGSNGKDGALTNLHTQVTKLVNNQYLATADLTTAVTTYKDGIASVLASAGLITQSKLNETRTAIYAKIDDVEASISTEVQNGISSINLSADKIQASTGDGNFGILAASGYARVGYWNGNGNWVSGSFLQMDDKGIGSRLTNANSDTFELRNSYLTLTHTQANSGFNREVKLNTNGLVKTGYGGFTVESSNGITLEGKTTVSGILTVSQEMSVGSDVGISGDLSVSEDLTVTGDTTLNGVSIIETTKSSKTVKNIDSKKRLWITASANDDTDRYIRLYAGGAYVDVYDGNDHSVDIFANDVLVHGESTLTFRAADSITANRSISVSSDERLKEIQNSLEGNINDIAAARIAVFKYKDSGNNSYLGAIAQDWQNVFPNAVTTDEEGYLSLDYSAVALASAITAAREIVELKGRVDAIENKLN